MMLNSLKRLLLGEDEVDGSSPDGLRLAVAALLVSAATEDGSFDAEERRVLLGLIERRFELPRDETRALLAQAEAQADRAVGLHRFITVINREMPPEQRIGLVEMLWEIVYADGRLDDYEANLMRRLGDLLGVSDFERGEARKRVLARRAAPKAGPWAR